MSSETPAASHIDLTEDEKILHKLGYAQELMRAMGAFRNFAISFTIISILAGLPHVVLPRVSVRRPGRRDLGLDHRRLRHDLRRALDGGDRFDVPDRRRPLLLVVEARQRRLGMVYGLVQPDRPDRDHRRRRLRARDFATALFNFWWAYPNDRHHIFYLFVGFLIAAALLNVFDVRITSMVNGFSAYWHVLGVRIIVGA